ncbi:MAG: hypothetical protein H7X70_02035, partial [Candidatus Kapabacteria bacterium]|nr:hypothetical protein [Candidatus Kapabacteria bacterium]
MTDTLTSQTCFRFSSAAYFVVFMCMLNTTALSQRKLVVASFAKPGIMSCRDTLWVEEGTPLPLAEFPPLDERYSKAFCPMGYYNDSNFKLEFDTLSRKFTIPRELPEEKYYLLSPAARDFLQIVRDSVGPIRVFPAFISTNQEYNVNLIYNVDIYFDSIYNVGAMTRWYENAYSASKLEQYPLFSIQFPQCFSQVSSVNTDPVSFELTACAMVGGIRLPEE